MVVWFVSKGRQIYVEERLTTREYEAKDGSGKRYRTEIIARQIRFLDRKPGAAKSADAPCVPARCESGPPGAAGNVVDQNRLKPCRGRPFGLYGELESERQNGNPSSYAVASTAEPP